MSKQELKKPRLCDFCGDSLAIIYCRADSAKLCLSCDKEVHSTNPLFTKHIRFILCDLCDDSPASIFCSSDMCVLCQNCDWESHSGGSGSVHDRRGLEGFSGCPLVSELMGIFGFEDVSKKELLSGDGVDDDDVSGYLVWDTPGFVSFDDLIVDNGSDHNFQAMGVPPLPKNRNATCGQYKEEILNQLRKMAKLEPCANDEGDVQEPLYEFQPLVPEEQNTQLLDTCSHFEHEVKPSLIPSYEANLYQWCNDNGEAEEKGVSSTVAGSYVEMNCLVPEKDSDIGDVLCHASGGHDPRSWHDVVTESLQVPKIAVRELNSQERGTAISRYLEKKKNRRYDKHIRYESRKVRAESRTRIRGRFAKIEQ